MSKYENKKLLAFTNSNEKDYLTFTIKERDSKSTADENLSNNSGYDNNSNKNIKKIFKLSKYLNSASNYWFNFCNKNNV